MNFHDEWFYIFKRHIENYAIRTARGEYIACIVVYKFPEIIWC